MQRRVALIAGILALLTALWFLGWMMVTINAIPLWVIITGVMGFMIYDFYQAMGEETDGNGNGGASAR